MQIFYVGLGEHLVALLETMGHQGIVVAPDSPEDLHATLKHTAPDVIVFDLGTCDWAMLEIERMRQDHVYAVVIGIATATSHASWSEKRAEFLERGGDDLIQSPMSTREFSASLASLTWRERHKPVHVKEFSRGETRILINVLTHTALVNGLPVRLGPKEFELLSLLVKRPGQFISKQSLHESLYATAETKPGLSAVRMLLNKLRTKFVAINPAMEEFFEFAEYRDARISDLFDYKHIFFPVKWN